MATKVQINPLIDIRNATFATNYEKGLYWRVYGWRVHGEVEAQGPLPESFLVENLKMCAQVHHFDGRHEEQLCKDIGYFIGMLHGGMVLPTTRQLRPDVTTLVNFTSKDAARGYRAGREWVFHEAEPGERQYTDERLIERFRELVKEYPHFRDKKGTWHYGIGCVLGELSGHLSPETPQERQEWEEECQKALTWEKKQHKKALRKTRCWKQNILRSVYSLAKLNIEYNSLNNAAYNKNDSLRREVLMANQEVRFVCPKP